MLSFVPRELVETFLLLFLNVPPGARAFLDQIVVICELEVLGRLVVVRDPAVADQQTSKIPLPFLGVLTTIEDGVCDVGDVLTSIRLASNVYLVTTQRLRTASVGY